MKNKPHKQTKLAIVCGTRPEAIKLAPVILHARASDSGFHPVVITTGQHQEMLSPVLNFFQIRPDIQLNVMVAGQTLPELTARLITRLDKAFDQTRPDIVVVQGDTTSAMCATLAAFYRHIPVAHVEAGLRTDRLDSPFPEELNRRVVGQIASWHFAPTDRAKAALLRDSVDVLGGQILVTGNTVIDALLDASRRVRAAPPVDADLDLIEAKLAKIQKCKLILVTGHRRENFGERFNQLCASLRRLAKERPDLLIVYPVHLNPQIKGPATEILAKARNIILTEPKPYPVFVRLMLLSTLIITDSGGVQEEAPALGKPVLVTRDTTERPEAKDAGVVALVGPGGEGLREAVTRLLDDQKAYAAMARGISPYGDGHASGRCLSALAGRTFTEFSFSDGRLVFR